MSRISSTRRRFGFFLSLTTAIGLIVFGLVWLGSIAVPVVRAALFPSEDLFNELPIATTWQATLAQEQQRSPARQPYPAMKTLDPAPSSGNWIHIPALDIHVPLVLSQSLSDDDIVKALESGAALYPNGVPPGSLGNTFIAGHSTAYPLQGKYRFAFMQLPTIAIGHYIHIDYHGTRYSYRVVDKKTVTPSSDLQIASDRPIPTVTMMTCTPVWTATNRLLVTGELTHVTKLTATPS